MTDKIKKTMAEIQAMPDVKRELTDKEKREFEMLETLSPENQPNANQSK